MRQRFLILTEPAETRCPVCGGVSLKALRVEREDAEGILGTVVLLCNADAFGDGCRRPARAVEEQR